MTKPDWLVPHSIVKNGVWVGVINDLYQSPSSERWIIEIRWVKNAYQNIPYELVPLDRVGNTLAQATPEELVAELDKFRSQAEQDAQTLVEMAH